MKNKLYNKLQNCFLAFFALSLVILPVAGMDKTEESTELSLRLPGAPPP